MTARDPKPIGITVLQTEGNHGAVVVAFEDQLAAHMKAEAFDHAALGVIAGAIVVILCWTASAALVRLWRTIARHQRRRRLVDHPTLGIGGNP